MAEKKLTIDQVLALVRDLPWLPDRQRGRAAFGLPSDVVPTPSSTVVNPMPDFGALAALQARGASMPDVSPGAMVGNAIGASVGPLASAPGFQSANAPLPSLLPRPQSVMPPVQQAAPMPAVQPPLTPDSTALNQLTPWQRFALMLQARPVNLPDRGAQGEILPNA